MERDLLERLYEAYSREIWLYLFSMSHSRALAEDLMQETFLKAILSLPDDHLNMRAWLYRVARNLYLNEAKRNGRNESLTDDITAGTAGEDEVPETVIRNERKQAFYRALGKLEARKREVLFLQYFSELNQKQIALRLGISPENVRILSYRAKKDLQKIMEV